MELLLHKLDLNEVIEKKNLFFFSLTLINFFILSKYVCSYSKKVQTSDLYLPTIFSKYWWKKPQSIYSTIKLKKKIKNQQKTFSKFCKKASSARKIQRILGGKNNKTLVRIINNSRRRVQTGKSRALNVYKRGF